MLLSWTKAVFYISYCSQSPIFSKDSQDRALAGAGGHFGFICTEGAGVPKSVSFTFIARLDSEHLRLGWSHVTQSARSRWSFGKTEGGLWKVYISFPSKCQNWCRIGNKSLQRIGEGKAANDVVSTIPLSLSSLAPSYSHLSFFFV